MFRRINSRRACRACGLTVAIGVFGLTAAPAHSDGACCLPDGSCVQVRHLDCLNMGGDYSGEGSRCEYIDCTGACCLPDGTCDDTLTRFDCEASNGKFRGNGLRCEEVVCAMRGACCLPDGNCEDGVTGSFCRSQLDGVWLGMDTTCATVGSDACFGACCYDNGTCEDATTRAECEDEFGGNFQGLGSACSNGVYCGLEDGHALNAITQTKPFNFVMISNLDRRFTFDKFDDLDGLRRLQRVAITARGRILLGIVLDNRGNDGIVDVNNTIVVSEDMRWRFEGNVPFLPQDLVSIWGPELPVVGHELTCPNNIVQPGQFCPLLSPYVFPGPTLDDPMAEQSWEVDYGHGQRSGGRGGERSGGASFIAGDGDDQFTMVLNPRAIVQYLAYGQGSIKRDPHRAMGEITVVYEYDFTHGACCLWDGSCINAMTETQCENQVGFTAWHGGATCDTVPQECEPVGACCLCDGTCTAGLTEIECQLEAGDNGWYAWHMATDCASLENCQPVGACCLIGEEGASTCLGNITQDECEEHPDAVWEQCGLCEDVCPELGACALPTGVCTIATQKPCQEAGGNYLGGGSACEASPSLCRGDANGDRVVDVSDMMMVITNWGSGLFGDLNSDGVTDVHDLVLVIDNWGRRCIEY